MRFGIDARVLRHRKAGISQYTLNLIRGLASQDRGGDSLTFLRRKGDTTLLPEGTNIRHRFLLSPEHHWASQISFPIETLGLGLDLLHSVDFIPPAIRTYKSIVTIHDASPLVCPEFIPPKALRFYRHIRWAVHNADHVIVPTGAVRDELIDLVAAPPDKVTAIHEGVNPQYTHLDAGAVAAFLRSRWSLEPGFLFYMGTIQPRKNLERLVRAYGSFKARQPRLPKLVLAGRKGWGFEPVDDAIAQLGLSDHVLLLGGVTDEEANHLYCGCVAFVFPTLYEGFGLPVLEAMASGAPVIASDIPVLREVIGDAALFVDPLSTDKISEAMERLFDDDDLRNGLVASGFQRVTDFSWKLAAQETLALYRKTASAST